MTKAKTDNTTFLADISEDPTEYQQTYQLKELKAKDTMKVWSMLRKVQANEEVRTALRSEDSGAIAATALRALMDEVEEEVIPFMVALIEPEMSYEEFLENEPAAAPFLLLEDLLHHDPFVRVLKSASRSGKAGRNLFGTLGIGSSSNSDSPTEN